MTFKRILIAIDDSAIAAHATNVGFDLARAVQAEVALITVVDPSQDAAPASGVAAADLIGFAEKEGKRMLADVVVRSAIAPAPLSFVPVGQPLALSPHDARTRGDARADTRASRPPIQI